MLVHGGETMALFIAPNGHEFSARNARLNILFRKANVPFLAFIRKNEPVFKLRTDLLKLAKISLFISDHCVHSTGREAFKGITREIQSLIDQCDKASKLPEGERRKEVKELSRRTYEVALHMQDLYPNTRDFGYENRWATTSNILPRTQRIESRRLGYIQELKDIAFSHQPVSILDAFGPSSRSVKPVSRL